MSTFSNIFTGHSQWSPFSRVRRRLPPFHMPYMPSPIDVREWQVEIDPTNTILNNPLPANGNLSVSLHRILIEAGIALTLATSSWDPRSWFSLYRYGADFLGTSPKLRFDAGVLDKDPRLTAVASEEVATGITCYLLREHFGLDHIADVYPCIQRGELQYVNSNSQSRPDYFCEDANGETVLAESKGATGTRCKITGRIDPEGWDQVQNVAPVNLPLRTTCSRAVIGTHFCVQGTHPRTETTTIIKDPDGVPSQEANPDSDVLIRLAYAKAMRFLQQDALAEAIMLRRDFRKIFPGIEDARLPQIAGLPFFPMGMTPFGGAIGFYGPTAKALLSSTDHSLRPSIIRTLDKFRNQRLRIETEGYTLSNGLMVIHDIDELI